jgi:hypothetical protein
MDAAEKFLKSLNLQSDFTAVSYNGWLQQEALQKPYRMIKRLKQRQIKSKAGINE